MFLGILGAVGVLLPLIVSSPQRATPSEPEPALEQIDPQHPCGVISVTVAGLFLGRPIDLKRAKEAMRVDGLGRCSMADVIDGLHRLGFSARGVRLQSEALGMLSGVPTILYVNQSHFMVVMPVGNGSVVVVDPPRAVECLPTNAFASRWRGEAIVVRNSPEELEATLSLLGILDN